MHEGTTDLRSSPRERSRARDFVVAPYSPDFQGVLVAVLPRECPLHSTSGPCDVRRKSQRARKTGPRFAVTVAKCHRHDICFTIYPPGYAPYQRAPVLALSPDGAEILGEDEKFRKNLDAFADSVFQPALDARDGKAWPRDADDGAPERWSTQRRHVDLALALTGISKTIGERTRELISTVLGVPLLLIREESRRLRSGYRDRGSAISEILAEVRPSRGRALRLLLAGHLAGRWGRPHSCHPRSRSLEQLPFYVPGTPAPT